MKLENLGHKNYILIHNFHNTMKLIKNHTLISTQFCHGYIKY